VGRPDRWTSDRDVSDFLLRLCHDLKSSVRAIRAHTELVQRDGKAPETPGFEQRLGFILDGVRKIDSLADGLSRFSIALQIDEASFQFTRMDFILRRALAAIDKELRNQSAEVISGDLPRVFGNPDRLVQIFEILLRNALRHRADHFPHIHITAEKQVDEWLFAVGDNGPGIDAAYLESIFKPFESLRTSERAGAGMGLAICRVIVERHGGKLWAESQPGTGSTFFFTLPVVGE